MKQLKFWIAVGLGSGLSPRAPGTTGTIGILPVVFFVWDASVQIWITGFVFLCALALWSISEAGRQLGEPDHGQIVIDEWAGMWLAAFGVNVFTDFSIWMGLLIGFIGFRIFDISKPLAVAWCEQKIPGPLGVLMDDVAAGTYVFILAAIFGILSDYSG